MSVVIVSPESLSESQIEDLCLAASYLTGAKRRAFQAEMTLKYCNRSARRKGGSLSQRSKGFESDLNLRTLAPTYLLDATSPSPQALHGKH